MEIEQFSHLKKSLAYHGYGIVPGVFTQDEVNAIRAEAIMSIARAKDAGNSRCFVKTLDRKVFGKDVNFPALSMWPALTSPYLDSIRRDPRLATIVQAVLGPDVKQLNNQFYFRLPGDGDEFAWHQDKLFRHPDEDFPGIEEAYLQTIVVVDELTEENGAVEYVPGSHKLGDLALIERNEQAPERLRQYVPGQFESVKLLAKPGDVVAWSVMVVHGSQQNKTPFPRMTYMNGFARADASKYFPDYMVGGKVVGLDPSKFPEIVKNKSV